MIIRKMKDADTAAVAALEKECFSEPWSETELKKSMQQKNYLFFVAEEKNQVLGYIGMYQILEEGDITNVAVTSSARNRGIGGRLLQTLMKDCLFLGVTCITLEVRESNQSAIHLYQKHGFSIEGVRKNYYSQPTENGLIMWNYDIAGTATNYH